MTTIALDANTAILSAACHEPEGVIERSVYPLILTPQNIQKFWESAKGFRTIFGDEINGDFKKFCEILMSQEGDNVFSNGLFWVIDDMVGVYYMTHIEANDAQIHYSFFDRRHHGRQMLTRRMIQFVFNKYKFRRLTAEIPFFAKGTFEFVEQVGLKVEGRKRKAAFMDDEWFDTRLYGILKEEATSWG